MDKEELEKGEKNQGKDEGEKALEEAVEGGDAGESPEEEPFDLNLDWVMKKAGPVFGDSEWIGELLLDKLNGEGVNTQATALAGMVNVLQQFSQQLKALNEAVGSNLDKINQLSTDNEDLATALESLLREIGMTKEDGGTPPPMDDAGASPDMGGEMPPDMGAAPGMDAGMPPDMGGGMPPDMGGGAPPDMGGGMPPDMGGGAPPDMGAPPPDMGGGMPPDMGAPPPGVMSDARMKKLASEAMRRTRKSMTKSEAGGTRISSGIIDACKGGIGG